MATKTLKPVSRVKLADEIQDRIRQAIVSGELPVGAPLAEPKLAEQFGISRAPIREALVALEREGLVEFTGGGRTRVLTIEKKDFVEICSLRSTYEAMAGARVATRWNDALAKELNQQIDRQRRCKTWAQLSTLDMAFHEIIVQAADHKRLLHAWRSLRSQCEASLVHFFGVEKELGYEPHNVTTKAHEEIMRHLSSGHPQQAATAMAEHAESWLNWLDRIH